jgi:hypothetical protein
MAERSALRPPSSTVYCVQKSIELSNMGRAAVESHQKSSSHVRNSTSANTSENMRSFFTENEKRKPEDISTGNSAAATSSEQSLPNTSNMEMNILTPVAGEPTSAGGPSKSANVKGSVGLMSNFTVGSSVIDSEIMWSLKVIMNHMSYNSCKNINEVFRLMFPDSAIAKKFALSPAKVAYTIVHGLAPYFSTELTKAIQESSSFVACFDEALNKVAQKGQMDIVVRFWDSSRNQVMTRYLTSVFLGHASAKDIEMKFTEGLSGLCLKKLIQISMDGPSVNWKFLETFAATTRPAVADPQLLDLGSCGLHVIHGAFQSGHKAAGWTVNELLRSMYGLFKDSPARRADYISETGSTSFPKKFCQVRWVENSETANRAIEIFPHVRKYVEEAKKLPNNTTCNNIRSACADPLAVAKLSFFASIASLFEPFLKKYQTDQPMMPFLHDDMAQLLRTLLQRFIKQSVMKDADSSYKLIKIDLASKDVVVTYKDVDIGVGAVKALATSKVSDLVKMQFRMDCLIFMKTTAMKIVERSPLKYSMVRMFTCLAPRSIIYSRIVAEKRMAELLQKLYEANHISAVVADRVKIQYAELCSRAQGHLKQRFTEYSAKERLDTFYIKVLGGDEDLAELWSIIKFVLILSHGQASVESGFSINADMLVENMHEESLVAQRQVYDAVKAQGGLLKVKIDKRMQQAARGAHSRYKAAMEVNELVSFFLISYHCLSDR